MPTYLLRHFTVFILFFSLVCILSVPSARAATLNVPGDYSTIQQAISAANTNDTIIVAAGTYRENITLNKTITIQGASYDPNNPRNNKAIIEGSNNNVITINSGSPTLRGLVIRGGNDGISVTSNFTAEYNYFVSNEKDLIGCEPGCGGVIAHNVFYDSGDDAIDIDGIEKNLLIEHNQILQSGQDGIEARMFDDSIPGTVEVVIVNNTFDKNDETGIQLLDYDEKTNRIFTITRNLFINNGLVGVAFSPEDETNEQFTAHALDETVRITHNTFFGNNYGITGSGAQHTTIGDGTLIANNIFVSNQVAYAYSNAANTTNTLVTHSLFYNNGFDYHPAEFINSASMGNSDPLFTNLSQNDFSLQGNSPAIDAGARSITFNGQTFTFPYSGSAPDLGYIEYGGVPVTPVPSNTPTPVVTVAPTSTPVPGQPTATPVPQVLGDANGDGKVTERDYEIWYEYYSVTTTNGSRDGDFNQDQVVDGIDYVIWMNAFLGTSNSPSPTTAPSQAPSQAPTLPPQPTPTSTGQVKAFPSAEGFGAATVGGRGGRVIQVTNLQDSGTGSLRSCVEASGPRTCVFTVAGTIELQSRLDVREPYLTIAGQTAPGGGITLRTSDSNPKGLFTVQSPAHDVIVRYIRIRTGEPSGVSETDTLDAATVDDTYNVIFDHVSMSWAIDELANVWEAGNHVTFQWSIFSEALDNSIHPDGPHSKALLLGSEGSHSFSVHHNLFAHNQDRHPEIKTRTGGVTDVVNNVIYNYGKRAGLISDRYGIPSVNYIGNYIKPGVNSGDAYEIRYYDAEGRGMKLFVQGNIGPHRTSSSQPESAVVDPAGREYLVSSKFPSEPITTTSAQEAYQSVLGFAGASRRLGCDGSVVSMIDAVDARIFEEVKNGTGRIIDNQSQVGGWPTIDPGTPCTDSDKDGMPDVFEQRVGFNPNQDDSAADADNDGYTNLEEYLNIL